MEFGDLKEKLHGPVRNARNIVIHQSMSDLFLKEFREQVAANPQYSPPPGMVWFTIYCDICVLFYLVIQCSKLSCNFVCAIIP